MAIMPGRITRNGKNIFGTLANSGVRRAACTEGAAMRALNHQKIRTPVAKREDEAQAHNHAEPLDAHRIGGGIAQIAARRG